MSEILDINETVERSQNEWLLFEVLETDSQDRPLRGRLVCRSNNRDDIHKAAMASDILDNYIVFTGDPVPPDTTVVL